MLTNDQILKYLQDPKECPYCNETDVNVGDTELDGNVVLVGVSCEHCDRKWREEYSLSGILED
jgi:sarcosine oxidase delta subunit